MKMMEMALFLAVVILIEQGTGVVGRTGFLNPRIPLGTEDTEPPQYVTITGNEVGVEKKKCIG